VARVRLGLVPETDWRFRFKGRNGTHGSIPPFKLRASVDVTANLHSKSAVMRQAALRVKCEIDTGSYLTTLPYYLWRMFDAVEWLEHEPGTPRSVKIAGGQFPYRLGRLSFRILNWGEAPDRPRGDVMDVTAVAMFLERLADDGETRSDSLPMLLGLQGGVFDKRTLRNSGGQAWSLEDPPPSA